MNRILRRLLGRTDGQPTAAPTGDAAPLLPQARVAELIAIGNALEDRGECEAALERYREATRLDPTSSRAFVNVGNALQLLDRIDEAIAAQRTALQLAPDNHAAHYNLGSLLARTGDPAGAEPALRAALRIRPEFTDAAIILADVLGTTARPAEAEAALREALARDPRSAGAAHNLALLLLRQDRIDDVEDTVRAGLRECPDAPALQADLASIYVRTGRAREAEPLYRAALAARDVELAIASGYLFSLNVRDDLDASEIFREHARLGALFDATGKVPDGGSQGPVDPARKLRIGYVSADLRQHPVGLFMRPVLERCDRDRFEAHCYASHDVDDAFTGVLRAAAANWVPVARLSNTELAERIRRDRIDILVDLSGHTDGSRLPAFAHRPAPVQATWLGYPNTTGMRSIDYRICDGHTDPPGATERFHTEQLWRLPNSQWCYDPPHAVTPAAQPHPCDPDAVVFGAFNQFAKVSDETLSLWAAILAHAPSARLRVLNVPPGRSRAALANRLEGLGVDLVRLRIDGRQSIDAYFGAISEVDIALDTHPYNGGTTTLDTLWMGVPIVGLRGERAIGRQTCSILAAAGVHELITESPADYVAMNVRLADDGAMRAVLRRSLRGRLELSPMMDADRFVRNLEGCYRAMWRAWCDRNA